MAAQPVHDKATQVLLEDFDTSAVGTLNLLEAMWRSAPEAVFVYMSTNKVYGDVIKERPLTELETHWECGYISDVLKMHAHYPPYWDIMKSLEEIDAGGLGGKAAVVV